jgi:hypothetical protein
MPAAAVLYRITNMGIHTPSAICSYKPTPSEILLLSKGLKFVPTAPPVSPLELQRDFQSFLSNLYSETSFTAEFKQLRSALSLINIEKFTSQPARNLTDIENGALLSLRTNPDIRILPADKNLGTVICDTQWFRKECLRQLNDTKTYTRSRHTLQQLHQDISTFVSCLDLSPEVQDKLVGNIDQTTLPKFYILPKIHKTPIFGRPIVGAHSAPTTKISKWVDSQLKRLLYVIPTYVKGSLEVLQRIQEFKIEPRKKRRLLPDPSLDALPDGLCLFAADVASLYPSIPQDRGVKAVREFLRLHAQGSPDPKYRIEEKRVNIVTGLLELVLTNNYFTFEDEVFHQLTGTAMGTNLAPSFATIYLHQYECGFFHKYRHVFPLVLRFIDDYFGVSLTTPEVTQKLLKSELEQPAAGIVLTVETGNTVPFLDLEISLNGNRLETKLFQKAMNLFLYNPYTSYQPRSVKVGLIKGEIIRYIRSCSREEDFRAILGSLSDRLQARGFPLEFISKVIANSPTYADRTELLKTPEVEDKINFIPLVLRYAPNTIAIKRMLPQLPAIVKLVYRKNRSLKDFLRTPVRPPDIPLPNPLP